MSATAARPAGGPGTACPRCGAPVADGQDWCLSCGDAARTRLAPTPNWRLPVALVAIVAALALLVLAISFVALTRDDAPVQQTTAAPAPAPAPPATTTAATTTQTTSTPGAATPSTATPAPGATTTTP